LSDVVAQESILPSLKEFYQMIFTFGFVTFAWLFFRMTNLSDAINYLYKIAIGISSITIPTYKSFIFYPVILILLDWINRKHNRTYHFGPPKFEMFVVFPLMILTLIYHSTNQSEFIYFAF